MEITLNGDKRTVVDGATIAALLNQFDLSPQRVAVELNRRLVRRAGFDQTILKTGDEVEIVTLVGGG